MTTPETKPTEIVEWRVRMAPEMAALIERLQKLSVEMGKAIDDVFDLATELTGGKQERVEHAILCADDDLDVVIGFFLLHHAQETAEAFAPKPEEQP